MPYACESIPTCNPTDGKTERNFVTITQEIDDKVEVITSLSKMILNMFDLQGDPEKEGGSEPPIKDLTAWAEKTEYKLDMIVLTLKHTLARIKG